MGMDDAYKMINQTLVSLINEIWELEEKAIITDEFKDLTNNDMHVIEAVGLGDGNNMSSIARKLNITVGSLTTAMNSLVNKRYVERHRSEEDRRVVLVKLTEKGVKAYHHHEDYHAGADLLQTETERAERQGVLLLQIPEHEGECRCGQGAGYEG